MIKIYFNTRTDDNKSSHSEIQKLLNFFNISNNSYINRIWLKKLFHAKICFLKDLNNSILNFKII